MGCGRNGGVDKQIAEDIQDTIAALGNDDLLKQLKGELAALTGRTWEWTVVSKGAGAREEEVVATNACLKSLGIQLPRDELGRACLACCRWRREVALRTQCRRAMPLGSAAGNAAWQYRSAAAAGVAAQQRSDPRRVQCR